MRGMLSRAKEEKSDRSRESSAGKNLAIGIGGRVHGRKSNEKRMTPI